MLKVWGRKTSSNVQKVMWAIGDLGLAHERVDIGGPFGKNKEPAYLAMNPNGLVPTLEDGDVMLWESNTIVRYLGARYGEGTLAPADLKTRAPDDVYARMRQHFSEVDATHLTFAVALMNALNRIAVGLRRAPAKKTSS